MPSKARRYVRRGRRRHRGGVYHRQDDPIHILTHALRMSGGRRRRMRGRGLGSAYRIAYPRDEMGRPLRGQVLNYF